MSIISVYSSTAAKESDMNHYGYPDAPANLCELQAENATSSSSAVASSEDLQFQVNVLKQDVRRLKEANARLRTAVTNEHNKRKVYEDRVDYQTGAIKDLREKLATAKRWIRYSNEYNMERWNW